MTSQPELQVTTSCSQSYINIAFQSASAHHDVTPWQVLHHQVQELLILHVQHTAEHGGWSKQKQLQTHNQRGERA
jgi:hypothetical protein